MDGISSFREEQRHNRLVLAGLCLLLVLVSGLFLFAGRYPKGGITFPKDLASDPLMYNILFNVRLPRIILAILAGAILSASGFTFQMIFSNPLVEPGFLGVSQGAAFGAALVIISGTTSGVATQISATLFGMLALFLSYFLAKKFRFGGWLLRLVLSGIAVSAIFSSALGVVKLVADPTKDLQDITFWMMGGLWNSNWRQLFSIMPVVVLCILVLLRYRWKLNLLSLQDRSAYAVGLNPNRDRIILLLFATIGTTLTISVTGLIGWVGLIMPHLARKLFGSDSKAALPGATVMGALFLLTCDTVGRTALPSEIPIGLLTSFTGAIIFAIILSLKKQEGKA